MKPSIAKRMLILTVILMDILAGMEFDLFVPSFPALQNHFGLTPSWVAAMLSVNFAGYCASLVFLGDLSDRYGRKIIIISGLLIFTIGSVLCLWPPSYAFLLIGRLLQGLGIAAPAILSFLIIADSYPLKEQQFLMGLLNGSMNIAVAAAPVIGSYIALYFNWQGNFAALLILGLIVLAMTLFFIPMDKPTQHVESISPSGLRGYIEIFQSGPLVLLMVFLLFTFVPYWIFVGMSPLLYIEELGVSLAHFGYYQGVLALVFAIGSILYGLMIKHYAHNQKKMLAISMLIFIVSLIMTGLAIFLNSTSPVFITITILIFVIGQIIPTTILYPICLNFLPHAKGRVSAVMQGARLILTAFGLQMAGYFYQGSFQNIGLIISAFILVAIATGFFVIRNHKLMNSLHYK